MQIPTYETTAGVSIAVRNTPWVPLRLKVTKLVQCSALKLRNWQRSTPFAKPCKPGSYMTSTRLNIQQFYVLSTQCICVWISEQTAIISLYTINWLVLITESVCLLRGTDWVLKYNSGWPYSLTGFKLLMKMVGTINGGDQTPCHLLLNKMLL